MASLKNGLRKYFEAALDLHGKGFLTAAFQAYVRLFVLIPEEHSVIALMGTILTQEGNNEKAIVFLRRANALDPTHYATLSNLGNAFKGMGLLDLSEIALRNALSLNPAFDDGFRNMSLLLLEMNLYSECLRTARAGLIVSHNNPEMLMTYGNVLHEVGQHEKSAELQTHAITLQPSNPHCYVNRAAALQGIRRRHEAMLDLKAALKIDPSLSVAYVNKAAVLAEVDQVEKAISLCETSIVLSPNLADGYINQGILFRRANKNCQALISLERSYLIAPERSGLLNLLLGCCLSLCDWSRVKFYKTEIEAMLLAGKPAGCPMNLFYVLDNPLLHKAATNKWLAEKCWESAKRTRILNKSNEKTVLAYFSPDYANHPVFKNLLPLLQSHDRARFRIIGFSLRKCNLTGMEQLFDEFHDVSDSSSNEIILLARSLDLDIAIDLAGFTEFSAPDIFNQRVAPIQINYLGYPGTLGASISDYIVADSFVIPKEFEHYYTENIARLPCFFMPYDIRGGLDRAKKDFRRADFDLPENVFIFCSFNAAQKITEEVFSSWIRILKRAQNSVFWIACNGGLSGQDLIDRFSASGINPCRIIVASRLDCQELHISRLGLADLMLDTYPYNSHTTACDSISVGLPLLTLAGKSFASRVSGSLLKSIGLQEMITYDFAAYEAMAVALYNDPDFYRNIRERLIAGISKLPDPIGYARRLERLFSDIVRSHRDE